jgi:hypothetical protein
MYKIVGIKDGHRFESSLYPSCEIAEEGMFFLSVTMSKLGYTNIHVEKCV